MKITVPENHAPRPSMTPIIDVVFNLLIFFLLASQFSRVEKAQEIELPEVSHIQAIAELPQSIYVNVHADGRFEVMDNFYSADGLDSLLAAAVERNPDQQVIIRSHRRAYSEHLVRAVELCAKNNIRSTGLALIKRSDE